jgi:hypothetical protein
MLSLGTHFVVINSICVYIFVLNATLVVSAISQSMFLLCIRFDELTQTLGKYFFKYFPLRALGNFSPSSVLMEGLAADS